MSSSPVFQDMLDYSIAILQAVADFCATPPIFYLFGLIMLAFVLSIIMKIIRPR